MLKLTGGLSVVLDFVAMASGIGDAVDLAWQ
jgi:hypothetical protein